MFATFPDSHSFPLFLIMSLPALFWFALFCARDKRRICLFSFSVLAFIFLVLVNLSGTRGIWLGFGVTLFSAWIIDRVLKYRTQDIRPVLVMFLGFLLAFLLSSFVVSFPQFTGGNVKSKNILVRRLVSLVNIKETSNKGRILIWESTLASIKKHPLEGVGIGNYPVVLREDISAAKAGASAHNLYLNVFAEIGLFGFILFVWILYEVLRTFFLSKTRELIIFLFCLIWVLAYSLTDAALFDGRAFLTFLIFVTVAVSLDKLELNQSYEKR